MARPIGLKDFSKRMKVVADTIGKNTNDVVRQAALEADQVGVLRTPVDTGRARANWLVSIGEPTTETVDTPDNPAAGTAEALAQARQATRGYKTRLGSIFITNNVEYIVPLDEGTSPQAPSGMSAFMVQAARDVLRKFKLLKGV